jgi:tRNA pseudouridine synthase 10
VKKAEMGEITSKEHNKLYSALVSCDSQLAKKELDTISRGYKVEQRTPNRVSKRRADLIRKKYAKIKKVKLKKNGTEFRVWIESDAGLYIKEFISGDEGRSKPSISGLLGKNCVCKELDVLRIF